MQKLTELLNKTGVKVWLMVGIPGSGKTTWCENNLPKGTPIVSRDIMRAKLGYTKNADEKAKLSRDKEERVTAECNNEMVDYLNKGIPFAIDDTNTSKFRTGLIKMLHDNGAYIIGVNFNTPLDVCIKRRDGQIPVDVMKKLYKSRIPLSSKECDKIIEVD